MMPIPPYSPNFNYRRNNYHFPYTFKNITMPINPKPCTPKNGPTHNIIKNNNKSYPNTTNSKFHSNGMEVNNLFSNCDKQDCDRDNVIKEESESRSYEQFFEIFGIKLYFDDLLILALLFFLYKEEVNDSYLYIVLFMLLLS